MKPLNLVSLLLFLWGVIWVLTLSERTVRKIQQSYYATIAPFLKTGSGLEMRARNFVKEVEHSEDLARRLASIEEEYGKLSTIEGRLRELERENNELRAALDFRKRSRIEVIPARVIKRQPATWWNTAIINRGGQDGIGPQAPVLAPGGLAGKVDAVDRDVASVILLTDERCQVSAMVEGTPEVGILSGQRRYGESPVLLLRHLSKDAKISEGMNVFTTGRGGLFPEKVFIGTVAGFRAGPVEGEAKVEPAVDFKQLEIVFAISGAKPLPAPTPEERP